MIKKLLPVLLIVIGGGAGVAAGIAMKPAPEALEKTEDGTEDAGTKDADTGKEEKPDKAAGDKPKKDDAKPNDVSFDYAKLQNQFIVPLVRDEVVKSVVVMSVSLEMQSGTQDVAFSVEPRLRDSFLRVLFDHAAIGGFDGAFANNQNLKRLRHALKESAYDVLGDRLNDVLITDIVRQDM